jgi:hypothetical protein
MTLLVRAVAGSRLYGTNKSTSDYDWYEVHDLTQNPRGKRRAYQKIVDGVDTIKVGFSDWVELCQTSHQALDCMFAPDDMCEVDLIRDFRHSYVARIGTVIPAFQRVIESFSWPDSTDKQKEHAVRLQFMINELYLTGRYNPRLGAEQRRIVMNTNVSTEGIIS